MEKNHLKQKTIWKICNESISGTPNVSIRKSKYENYKKSELREIIQEVAEELGLFEGLTKAQEKLPEPLQKSNSKKARRVK